MKRTLTLRSEHLAELSTAELVAVVGGQDMPTNQCTGHYESLGGLCDRLLSLGC